MLELYSITNAIAYLVLYEISMDESLSDCNSQLENLENCIVPPDIVQ